MKEFSSILKLTDSSTFRARICVLFNRKVVSCCIKFIVYLIAFITSIETEALLLALAKSIYYRLRKQRTENTDL